MFIRLIGILQKSEERYKGWRRDPFAPEPNKSDSRRRLLSRETLSICCSNCLKNWPVIRDFSHESRLLNSISPLGQTKFNCIYLYPSHYVLLHCFCLSLCWLKAPGALQRTEVNSALPVLSPPSLNYLTINWQAHHLNQNGDKSWHDTFLHLWLDPETKHQSKLGLNVPLKAKPLHGLTWAHVSTVSLC